MAKLRVLVAVLVFAFILVPQDVAGNADTGQLVQHVGEEGHCVSESLVVLLPPIVL